jgi:allophanate hydrolase
MWHTPCCITDTMYHTAPLSRTPLEAARAALDADRAHADPAIWITRLPDAVVLQAATELESSGPEGRSLWGTTFAVKDNIDAAGIPTTAGCPDYAYTPSVSAVAVQKLLDAGAILLGKTNLDQFATGLVGVRSPYGVPRNVFDPARVPGGSSSGSAIAVAAGIVDFALGTDTAGSGRVPAAFGSIVGLKPTIGSVSAAGMVPACRSIDTISVFARDTATAMQVGSLIAGFDPADPYSRPAPFPYLRPSAPPPALRIAVAELDHMLDPEWAAGYHRASALFDTHTIDLSPFLAMAKRLYDGPWVAERTSALRSVLSDRPDSLHPTTRAILQGGLDRLTVDAFDAFHDLALLRRTAQDLFANADALLLPTAPFCPTLSELAADPIGPNSRLGSFTNFVNLCDLAAIAVPAGFGSDGLPVGVTLIGPAWSEGRLAAIAASIHETLVPGTPKLATSGLQPGETGLFCIGAHMSGLKLNGQITALGGRFLHEAATQPTYRLFSLGARPGLLKTSAGGGRVLGEVWALPEAAIGRLLAMVPPPLGFGTVDLETGPCLGFLAEPSGIEGTPDITHHGGWRTWLASLEQTA